MANLTIKGDLSRIAQFCDAIDEDEQYLVSGYTKSEIFKNVAVLNLKPQTTLAAYMDAAYILKNLSNRHGYELL